ncbi:hypothetical protein BO78DRAFT_450607 [Aspergillus sclerotiicarbonarius CBS 121057]|uniref:Peptidase metallopeptidase domain-containing protein n=1 Tax=Aspergillus sclerotiicarbonarius (strain CBS 121057 / IBT 28362) TaxID=1448318 RepID=A0A319EZZ0_ASPSB|nr:hypothetical protein BO78DRAFT_450607 [Aspergillus sclerotiicarbonarius CBS 121057]
MASLQQWAVFLLLSIFSVVDAGHPDWEHARFSSPAWVSILPGFKNSLWPKSTIPLCYESDLTRKNLHDILWAAMRLWYAAGLRENFRLLEISELSCTDNPFESLHVEETLDVVSSDIGMPIISMASDKDQPDVEPPTLKVFIDDDDLDWTVRSVAHELGHAFGLVHEHQNPSFWYPDGTDRLLRFYCMHLHDFAEVTEGMSKEEIWGKTGVCRNIKTAQDIGFSAAEWLPEEAPEILTPHPWWGYPALVDWDSIMLYKSFGDSIDEDKIPVLTKPDGSTWDSNWQPSTLDVSGLKDLYKSPWANPKAPFWNDVRSPYFSLFRKFTTCA